MGGELSMLPGGLGHTMFPDAPPLLPPGAVAEFDGGVIGALVSLAGLYHSECRGADVIDVSSTEACVSLNRWLVSHYDESGWIETRATRSYPYAGMFECADGYVMLQPSTDAQWANLVEMMGSPEWATRPEYRTRAARNEAGKAISTELRRWVMTRTKNDILHGGLKFGIPAAPFRDAAEVASCTQYASRGFFVAYDPDPSGHRDDHSPSVPGLPFAAHPFGPPRLRRAPNLGEHNEAVADLLAEFHSGQRQPAAVVSGGTR
jgi:crotonobetainyl-CoA:carnitine CoA-transferase CaiB-like acyl-CoA transferase